MFHYEDFHYNFIFKATFSLYIQLSIFSMVNMRSTEFKVCLIYALKDLTSRKTRTAFTILGIIVGIAAMTSLMTIGTGMKVEIEREVTELLGSSILLRDREQSPIPMYVAFVVNQIPGVNETIPLAFGTGSTNGNPTLIFGVSPHRISIYAPITAGRNIGSDFAYEALITTDTAKKLKVNVGDKVTIITTASPTPKVFTLVGIVAQGSLLQMALAGGMPVMVVSLAQAQQLLNLRGSVSMIVVRVSNPMLINSVVESIKEYYPVVEVITQEDVLRTVSSIISTINAVLLAIASLSLIVAALGIINTMTMTVREKTREIGILKAIGAERWHVFTIFIGQAVVMGFLGGIIGVTTGFIGAYGIIEYYLPRMLRVPLQIPFVVSMDTAIEGIILALIVSSVSAFLPSWKAANIRPVEALRYE